MTCSLLEDPLEWRNAKFFIKHTCQRGDRYPKFIRQILDRATGWEVPKDLTTEARPLAVEATQELLLYATCVVHA